MRNIAEIIEDDRRGKRLSQTERQIAVAYIQGKYDAVRELRIGNSSNTDEVLDKIKVDLEKRKEKEYLCFDDDDMKIYTTGLNDAIDIIDKYKAGSKDIKAQTTEFHTGEESNKGR